MVLNRCAAFSHVKAHKDNVNFVILYIKTFETLDSNGSDIAEFISMEAFVPYIIINDHHHYPAFHCSLQHMKMTNTGSDDRKESCRNVSLNE